MPRLLHRTALRPTEHLQLTPAHRRCCSRTWNDGRQSHLRKITVPTLSFGHLIERYHLEVMMESIPFFKIDCEGCEYSVIPTFTDEQWDKIQVRPSLPHSSCVRVCVCVCARACVCFHTPECC